MVTKENTTRISFYLNTSSDEFGTGSSYNQSTDDQCVPRQLPFCNRVSQSDLVKWGKINGVDITVSMNVINEVVYWHKNVFLVPYGKIGKDFIDELTLLNNDWNYETERQHCSPKGIFSFTDCQSTETRTKI